MKNEEKSDEGGEAVEAPEATETAEATDEKLASENDNLRKVIANLKKKLSQERDERTTERKARRGLAIAKQLVVAGLIDDSYDTIKTKVAEIVKLEDNEIDRLEKKVAGEQEFDAIEDAEKEVRRQARISRINRQAAAEAQEDGDEMQADFLDKKADEAEAKMAHAQHIVEEMKKSAATPEEKVEVAPVEEKKVEEKADAPVVEEKKEEVAATPVVEEKVEAAVAPVVEEEKADAPAAPVVEEKTCEDKCSSDESTEKLSSMARKYRSIAANHRKLAEKAELAGDIEAADKQDELADKAEETAEDIEQKLAAETPVAPVVEKEEKSDDADADDAPASTPEEKTDDSEESPKASHKEPGNVVTSSKHSPLKREGQAVEESESFGIDKNASLVEQNDYSNDPEVELLSKMWRGADKDDK
jgi:hypothetical protein